MRSTLFASYFIFFLGFGLISTLYSQDCSMTGSGTTHDNCVCDFSATAVKKVRITIHVFLDDNGNNNIPDNGTGNSWLTGVVNDANAWMRQLATYNSNPSASISDSKIEFDLKNIYFWSNTTMHNKNTNSVSNGTALYNYVKSQSISYKNNSIHILIPGDDNSQNHPFRGRACSFGCKKWTIFQNTFHRYQNDQNTGGTSGRWETSNLFRHELGHNLNLHHTNNDEDHCSDTHVSTSNNVMHDSGGSKNSLTNCQAGRMHNWLNSSEGIVLLSAGVESSSLSGTISSSGYYGPLLCCTQNISASSGTLTVSSPGVSTIDWVETGNGSGSHTSTSNGGTVNLSNLGSINLKADWAKNCIDYSKTYTFFNGGSYLMSGPNPTSSEVAIEIKNLGEWKRLINSTTDGRLLDSWSLFSSEGDLITEEKRPIRNSRFNIQFSGLKPGSYYLLFKGGAVEIKRHIQKI